MIIQDFHNLTPIDIIIIICWLAVIALLAIAGILYLIKALIKTKEKDKSKRIKNYLFGIGTFFLLYSVNRFIFFLHELFFDPFMWSLTVDQYARIMMENKVKFIRYDIIWRISTGIGSYGLLAFLYQFEKQILEKRTHFVFSIIQGVTATFSIIFGAASDYLTLGRVILYLGLLPVLAIPFLYFYLGMKASGNTRIRAIGAGFGFLIFYIGVACNSSAGKTLFTRLWGLSGLQFSYILYGLFVTLGLIIYIKSIQY